MREIEFRGKRVDNGEWVYGYYHYTFDRDYYSQGYDDVPCRCHYIDTDCRYFEVDPETVGQYTGLKDANGVKIYEGDMLGHKNNIVEFCFGCFNINGDIPVVAFQSTNKVIGNIHDNVSE